jgi:4-amino-4-deoxy-L-arabinose transferase-like glycosyltransferase
MLENPRLSSMTPSPEAGRRRIARLATVPNMAALGFFLLTVLTAGNYGFFGDELYYIACSKHLAFGYVDHPPMVAFLALLSRTLFGETLIGLRILSGLAGAVTVLLSARIARKLGGGPFAESLAALAVCFAPGYPALSSFFSMNPFDVMMCTLVIFLFLGVSRSTPPRKWIIIGIVLGLGLLNKYTFLSFGLALFLGLLATRQRALLRVPWIYLSGGIALLIFLPHILWQVSHDWPTMEFMSNVTRYKNLSLSPLEFSSQLILILNPVALPLWIGGVIYILLSERTKEYRFLGWTAILFVSIYLFQNSKSYYVLPVFPFLLASGSAAADRLIQKLKGRWPRPAILAPLVISGILLLPLSAPILPVETFVSYSKTLGLWNAIRMETGEGDRLPLHYVLRFGWEELVDEVSRVYHALPEEEREECAIFGSWYGPAGAIDHFGPRRGLPNAISGRNSYWFWGPGNYTGEVVIALEFHPDHLKKYFGEVKRVGRVSQPYGMTRTIFICRKPRAPLKEMWPEAILYI